MISVIVPVYKVEAYLRKCVDSVLAQTYSNLEVILVDDGSPDNCGAICDEYAALDARIKVIHKENGGLSSARNAGLEVATGQFIAFVDSDDWIDSDMYQKLHDLLIEYDADIAEGGYRFYRPWKTENQTLDCANTQKINVYSGCDLLNRFYFGPDMFGDIAVMVWNKLYRANLLQNFRFCEGILYEDAEFTPRILYSCKKLVKYDHSFYTYNIRLEPGQISHSGKSAYRIKSAITSAKNVADFFKEHYVRDITEHTFQRYLNTLTESYFNCWERRKDQECREVKKDILKELKEHRTTIKKDKTLSNNRQLHLFFTSPWLFCWLKYMYRSLKSFKYRIRVFVTGKN